MQLDDTAHILGSADFFSICNLEQRRMLAFASERKQFEAGSVLFNAGDVTSGAYVLISGELVSKDNDALDAEVVHISQPGTVIAELALIAEHPRRSSVVCETNVELLAVPRSAFGKLMEEFPDVASRAMELIRNDIGKFVSSLEGAGIRAEKKR